MIHFPFRTATTPGNRPARSKPALVLGAMTAAVAVALAPTLAAGPANAAEADDQPSVLKVATSSEIDTLNPFTSILSAGTKTLALQYESLVQYGAKDNTIVPGMATKWTTSVDGETWDFTIPNGRDWSDGEPVTAEDVAWTFTAIQKDKKLQQANGGLLENVEKAVATDANTVRISLKKAQATNPGAGIPIVPKHVWSKVDDASTYANDSKAVGSGPFTVQSYAQGQSVKLIANKSFWRGAPKIDGITYVYYKNTDAAVQGLKTGEVDLVSDLQPAQFEALKSAKNVALNAGSGRRYTALAINPGAKDATGQPLGNGNPALQDTELRRAISMAIDKKTLLEKVRQGFGKLGETTIPPIYPNYTGINSKRLFPFDPAAANKQLDDAGYKMGGAGIRLDKAGKPLQLRLLGRTSDPAHAQMAEYIGPWLKAIGIGTTVTMQSDDQVNIDSTLGKYDMYFTGWGIGPDPDSQLAMNTCGSRPNSDGTGQTSESNWCDPEFDRLYAAQHAELDSGVRAEIIRESTAIIYKAAANNVIWYADYLEAYRSDRFTGFALQPAKGGVITGQNGYWGLYAATPVETDAAGDTAVPVGVIVVGTVALVVVVVGAFLLIRRRRATADDRE